MHGDKSHGRGGGARRISKPAADLNAIDVNDCKSEDAIVLHNRRRHGRAPTWLQRRLNSRIEKSLQPRERSFSISQRATDQPLYAKFSVYSGWDGLAKVAVAIDFCLYLRVCAGEGSFTFRCGPTGVACVCDLR